MKLFQISYVDDIDEGNYLTIGRDSDTQESIKHREWTRLEREDKVSCLMFLFALEVKEVDGYEIIIKEKSHE